MTDFTIMEAAVPAVKRSRASSMDVVRVCSAAPANALWFGDAYTHAQAQGARPRGPAPV